MKKILIFGAGSIGNHMTNASLKINSKVFITDINKKALLRMRNEIFPSRYGKWNHKINLVNYDEVFENKNNFDLIIIGSPPHTHLEIFKKIKKLNS